MMFVAFAVAAALWGALLLRAPSQRHALHHLMSALVVAKTLTLLSQAGMYHYIRATGSPDGWNIAFYIFTFLRGMLFFTVRTLCMPALGALSHSLSMGFAPTPRHLKHQQLARCRTLHGGSGSSSFISKSSCLLLSICSGSAQSVVDPLSSSVSSCSHG